MSNVALETHIARIQWSNTFKQKKKQNKETYLEFHTQ